MMKKIFTLILVFTLILNVSGCAKASAASNEHPKTAVCFVLGNHANSKGLNLNSPLVQDTVYETVRWYGFIGIVNVDGDPEVIHAASYDIDEQYKKASARKLDSDARAKSTALLAGMQKVAADDPEADYLASLKLAARLLSSLEGYEAYEIIVVGTGISTTGVLNFHNNLLSAEASAVVGLLEEKSEIPDLKGVRVYWQQLADVAAPQKSLTGTQTERLQEMYGGIVEKGGGSFKYDEFIANPVDPSLDLPAVTPVDLPSDTPIAFEADTLKNDAALEEPWILTEEKVCFIADSARYLNEAESLKTLRPIAEYLNAHPEISILLAGTTAGDEDSYTAGSLAKERAETVRQSLASLNVDPSRIMTAGLMASENPWHIWGAGYDGPAAAANRSVILVNAASETAAAILKKH